MSRNFELSAGNYGLCVAVLAFISRFERVCGLCSSQEII